MKLFGAPGAALVACLVGLVHCGGRTFDESDGSGGDSEEGGRGSGGATTGGVPTKGGARTKGGAPSKGGTPTTGGAPSKGGAPNMTKGGAPSTGGVPTSGGAMTMGGAPGCPPGLVPCGFGSCTDVTSDPKNCGSCGTVCATGMCAMGSCLQQVPHSCLDILQSGQSHGDDYYAVAVDPTNQVWTKVYCDMGWFSGGWTRCLDFTNSSLVDVDDNTWFDSCVDYANASWNRGEVFVRVTDASGIVVYAGSGKRSTGWSYTNVTCIGSVESQASITQHQPIQLQTGDQLWISGRAASTGGCVGALSNGYGIMISSMFSDDLRLLMMPYLLQVGDRQPRQFGFDNKQWTPSNEISFKAGDTFDSCGAPPAFLGRLEFFIR